MPGDLIFNCVVDWERPSDSHTLLPVDEQSVDLVFEITLEVRLGDEKILVLCLGLLQLAVQISDGILDFADFLHQPDVCVIATQLQVWPVTSCFETCLRDFERIGFVVNRLSQHVDVLFDVENLLLRLVQV